MYVDTATATRRTQPKKILATSANSRRDCIDTFNDMGVDDEWKHFAFLRNVNKQYPDIVAFAKSRP